MYAFENILNAVPNSIISHYVEHECGVAFLSLGDLYDRCFVTIELVVVEHGDKHVKQRLHVILAIGRIEVQFAQICEQDHTLKETCSFVDGDMLPLFHVLGHKAEVDECYLEVVIVLLRDHDIILLQVIVDIARIVNILKTVNYLSEGFDYNLDS